VKYMMFVCSDGSTELSQEEAAQVGPAVEAWVEELGRRGIRLDGHELAPVSDATTVRVRGGELLLTDGPFAETKEHIAGYDIIECQDLDEAIEVAAKHPVATFGMIEVRPFWEE
jgi:hypothetical protein